MVETNNICPNCGKNLFRSERVRMLDAVKLYCRNCKKDFIKYSRSGVIK